MYLKSGMVGLGFSYKTQLWQCSTYAKLIKFLDRASALGVEDGQMFQKRTIEDK